MRDQKEDDMNDQTSKRSFPNWAPVVGVIFGALTLVFFMILVLLSIFGQGVPPNAEFLVLSTLALGVALAAAFLGGSAAAEGKLPIPGVSKNPGTFSATGGIAVFIIVLLLGFWKYPDVEDTQRVGGSVRPSGVSETPVDTVEVSRSVDDIVPSLRSWPGVLDMLDSSDSGWYVGSTAPDEDESVEEWERRIVGGRYRWDMVFSKSWLKYSLSPHGSAADFFTAVDVVFSAQSVEDVTAGLVFGHVGNVSSENREHYDLHITSTGEWGLSHARGLSNNGLRGPSKPSEVAIDIQQPVRIGVLVEDGYMRFFVNGVQVGDWREPNFNGGDVGLFVASNAGSVVVEFDNFELRRKPRL